MIFSMNFFYVYGFMKVTLFCCRNWWNHRIESREWVALNTCQTESIYRHNGLVIVSFGIFSLSRTFEFFCKLFWPKWPAWNQHKFEGKRILFRSDKFIAVFAFSTRILITTIKRKVVNKVLYKRSFSLFAILFELTMSVFYLLLS